MIGYKEVFTYNDQPVTCPYCGNRTEILWDFYFLPEKIQVHKCLSKNCKTEIVTKEDIE